MSPSEDTALRFLQIVGLSLPAVALYLGVLTDIHMTARRETGTKLVPKDDDWSGNEFTFEPDRFTAHLTDAGSHSDFLIGVVSLIGLLVSGLSLGLYLLTSINPIYYIGVGLLMFGFLLLGTSCALLARTSFRLVRE